MTNALYFSNWFFIENPVAIRRHLEWLQDGKKRCVLISILNPLPAHEFLSYQTPIGTFLYKDIAMPEEIQEAINKDSVGSLLGYGIPRKPKIEDLVGGLTLMDERGIELLSILTDREHYAAVLESLERLKAKNDEIRLMQSFEDLLRIHYQRLILASDYANTLSVQ